MNGCEEFCQRQRQRVVLPVSQALVRTLMQAMLPACVVMFGSVWSVGAVAAAFQAPMDASRWLVDGSVHECRISHEIPNYGQAIVAQSAGEKPKFQLRAQTAAARSGTAALLSVPPLWKPQGASYPLARVEVKTGVLALAVEGEILDRLLGELLAGQEVMISGALLHRAGESASVVLSPVNFRRAYQRYQQCLASLLPVNFEQIRRTALYFPSGSDELPQRDLARLDHIARYAEADGSVQSFYVDGHSDSAGDRGANLELSQRRAANVVSLLLARGIPLDKITTRWHGERYPVTSNRAAEGQAKNRRVTVRLERVGVHPSPIDIKEEGSRQEAARQQDRPHPDRPDVVQAQVDVDSGRGNSASWWLQ